MHLAQLNIARLRNPIDHPATKEFVDGLEPINALAESSDGFVWRLQTDDGDATSLRPHPDPDVIVNLTLWESPQALQRFVYASAHSEFVRRRQEWFEGMNIVQSVAWWVESDHRPSIDEAFARLAFLQANGGSPYAFRVTATKPQLSIRRVTLDNADALQLIDELNAELSQVYPEPGSTFFKLDPDQVVGRNGVFLVASLNDVAVGCGAFRVDPDDNGVAEVKRMYIRQAARGLKIGAAVVAELERWAVEFGVRRLVLETGVRQGAATTVYTRAGFEPCPCWGEYAQAPLSRCFQKSLEGSM
jgi:GNAT superfamily N-acetyltransferase/heme-degrading monooxygenase HmoA